MKASEAKELSLKNDSKTIKIRKQIDKLIEQRAKAGERYCEPFFEISHNKDIIIKSLRADGYKVRFDYVQDPRDGSCSYNYRISW